MGSRRRLLAVEDDPAVAELLRETFASSGDEVEVAGDGRDALSLLDETPFDILITDIRMPHVDGLELLTEVKRRDPLLPVILLTGVIDVNTAVKAMRLGADDYMLKPFTISAIMESVDRALERHEQRVNSERYRQELEEAVEEKTERLSTALNQIHSNFDATVEAMVSAIEARDCETQHHCRRARAYTSLLTRRMGITDQQRWDIEWGSLLHDVGKIGVRDSILLKKGPLSEDEWDEMRKHPVIGYRLLKPIEFLAQAAEVVLHHHEKWDGSGYPYGKVGDEIPLGARIFMVADAIESITSRRPYKAAQSFEWAYDEVIKSAGTHFDPEVIKAFEAIPVRKWGEVCALYRVDSDLDHIPAMSL